MAEGTGFTGMPPYAAYGMGPPTTALPEATTASEPVASSTAPRWYAAVSAASPICSDFQTFCPDWLHFGHFLCFGGIAASQLSHRIFPIYF